jgi:purine-binding chemotaxis protein CheW
MESSNYIEQKKNMHLYFQVGDSKYAINTDNVLEIMKLPALDYPQKLPNNIVGLLKYNNFVINVIDIRFYLDIEVLPYTTENELLIVKTDESIFGIITDKVIGILSFNAALVDSIPFVDGKMIIDSLYKLNKETMFIINTYAIEKLLKEHGDWVEANIASLFPQDSASKEIFAQRALAMSEKTTLSLVSEFSKSKYISFNLNNDSYCIELSYIKEVLKDTIITDIPGTPDFIEGIINLRGDYITVLNLKKFLSIPSEEIQEHKPVIIVRCNELELAFLIDQINQLFEAQIDKILDSGDGYFQSEFIYRDIPYTILNVEKIFADKKIIVTDM